MPITVSALNVYPVKGLKGIALTEARCTSRGIEHDRRWMVVAPDGEALTQRDIPRMATVWTDLDPGVLSLSAPDRDAVVVPIEPDVAPTMSVRVWSSVCQAAPVRGDAHEWLSDYLETPCRLVCLPDASRRFSNPEYAGPGREVGFADAYAYLLVGEASLGDLNQRLAAKSHPPLPMNRFRPNIVVKGSGAFAEDGWKRVSIGDVDLGVVKHCGRCQVTTTDQATGEVRGPEPLATLSTYRNHPEFGPTFGMNLVTLAPGTIRVGDALEVSA